MKKDYSCEAKLDLRKSKAIGQMPKAMLIPWLQNLSSPNSIENSSII